MVGGNTVFFVCANPAIFDFSEYLIHCMDRSEYLKVDHLEFCVVYLLRLEGNFLKPVVLVLRIDILLVLKFISWN